MRFAFIHAEKAKYPTSLLCRALKVSRSGFYAWGHRPPSRREVEDSKLVPVIRACHAQSRATYGSPAGPQGSSGPGLPRLAQARGPAHAS